MGFKTARCKLLDKELMFHDWWLAECMLNEEEE